MRRPFWMNVVFLFCVYMTFVYLPWDVFVKPIAEDEEVWFGFILWLDGKIRRDSSLDCL